MSEKLLPCPYCGGETFMMADNPFVMFCPGGNCPMLDCSGDTYEEMAARWNRRSLRAAVKTLLAADVPSGMYLSAQTKKEIKRLARTEEQNETGNCRNTVSQQPVTAIGEGS